MKGNISFLFVTKLDLIVSLKTLSHVGKQNIFKEYEKFPTISVKHENRKRLREKATLIFEGYFYLPAVFMTTCIRKTLMIKNVIPPGFYW